jgi:hypothetical protein
MTYEQTEQCVRDFVAGEIRDGACPVCVVKAMIGVAIDAAFEHGTVEDVHAVLRRCVAALDHCQTDQPEIVH